jgi:4-amino-4-deoxy-L-arabinose transferase-like glycosyltransferase
VNRFDLPNIHRRRKYLPAIVAGIVAAAGVWILSAPPGPGLDPDAASYLGAAASLAHGRGYRIPIADWRSPDSTSALAHFPPGYPTALAAAITAGAAPTRAARIVNAAAAFVTVAAATALVTEVAGLLPGLALAVALLVMHAVVIVHLSVLSEPLFLTCLVCTPVAMASFQRAPNEHARLATAGLAGLAAAGAVLVRYAGIAMVAAVVFWCIIPPASFAVRLRRAVVAALPAAVLFGAWVARSYLMKEHGSIRAIGMYGGFGDTLTMGFSTVVAWVVPLTSDDSLPGRSWIALVVLAVLVLVVVRGVRAARERPAAATLAAVATLAVCYLAVLVASRLLADPGIPFDERILVPLFLLAAIGTAIALATWSRTVGRGARAVAGVLLLGWLAASFRATEDDVEWMLENGSDFAQAQWSDSPLLAWARSNAARRPLYSNWPAAIVFHLQRTAHEAPNDSTPTLLAAFADTVRARGGVVLAFDQPSPDQIGPTALARASGLYTVIRVADGAVFAARTAPTR